MQYFYVTTPPAVKPTLTQDGFGIFKMSAHIRVRAVRTKGFISVCGIFMRTHTPAERPTLSRQMALGSLT